MAADDVAVVSPYELCLSGVEAVEVVEVCVVEEEVVAFLYYLRLMGMVMVIVVALVDCQPAPHDLELIQMPSLTLLSG